MPDVFNPLDSVSNNIYEKFVNIIKFTEFYGEFGDKVVNENNAVVFRGDVTEAENYSMSSQITSHPVYKKTDITDNARPSDFIVTVTGISSDASMSYFDTLNSAINSNIGSIVRGFANQPDAEEIYLSKSQAVFAQLKKWWETGTPLSIDCAYDVNGLTDQYNNLAAFIIQNLNIPRTAALGSRAIKFSMSLKQIRFAKVEQSQVGLYSYGKGTQPSDPNTNGTAGTALNDKAEKMDEPLFKLKGPFYLR